MRQTLDNNLEGLKLWLLKNNTDPDLFLAILNFVKGKGYKRFSMTSKGNIIQEKMVRDMNRVGWCNFMERKVPKALGDFQEIYSLDIHNTVLRKRCMSNFIRLLTRGILKLWLERNNILYTRTKNGMLLKDAEKLWNETHHQL